MGSLNYSRKRLQKVYTWDGHDPTLSQVRAQQPEKLLLGERFLLVEDQPSFTREATITYDTAFFQKFSSSLGPNKLVDVPPTVLVMDASGDQAVTGALGNVFIATAPTVASVTVGASNDGTGKLGVISTIII
jgi:hypothetical protein|tara:strand:- start:3406 stop:3801 length:396 start_codon:yes stop_codon:yes gene_type:complete